MKCHTAFQSVKVGKNERINPFEIKKEILQIIYFSEKKKQL